MPGKNNNREELNSKISSEHIYLRYYEALVFYAFKFVNDIEIAKDLTQDAFFGFLKKRNVEDIINIKSFLYQSVRNNCLNYIDHNSVERKYEKTELRRLKSEIEFYNNNTTIIEQDLYEKLIKIFDQLPERYKIPLKLSRFENQKNKEISEKLGIPVRTVETRIYRGLIMLRKKLGKNVFLLFTFIHKGFGITTQLH